MGRQVTQHQEEIYELRRHKRWTFQKIANSLGITKQSVVEAYQRALKNIHDETGGKDLPQGMTIDDLYRLEEMGYIEGVLERYMKLADANEEKKPRTAIEALNGAHRYLDSLIKIKGILAPVRVHHTFSTDAIEGELSKVKAELENVIEGEVVEDEQTPGIGA